MSEDRARMATEFLAAICPTEANYAGCKVRLVRSEAYFLLLEILRGNVGAWAFTDREKGEVTAYPPDETQPLARDLDAQRQADAQAAETERRVVDGGIDE